MSELTQKNLFSHYDRKEVVWGVLVVDTATRVELSISVGSLCKAADEVRCNVIFVHGDEVITVGPHRC